MAWRERGKARLGAARRGWAWRGPAWHGRARQGKGANGPVNFNQVQEIQEMKIEHKYDEIVEAMNSRFADWNRGSVIPWNEIELAMGRCRTGEGGWQIVNRFRRHLLKDREIATIVKDNIGIRLLMHEEAAAEIPGRRQKRAYRQVNRGLRETSTVNIGALKEKLRLTFVRQRENMIQHRLAIGRSNRSATKLVKASQTHPVRRLQLVG